MRDMTTHRQATQVHKHAHTHHIHFSHTSKTLSQRVCSSYATLFTLYTFSLSHTQWIVQREGSVEREPHRIFRAVSSFSPPNRLPSCAALRRHAG